MQPPEVGILLNFDVRKLFIYLASAVFVSNLPAATNAPMNAKAPSARPVVSTNDPVERELQKLMEADDAAQAEVDQWIQDNEKFAAQGAGVSREELNSRIRKRLAIVRSGYDQFVQQHTNHVKALVAYASFLGDIQEEEAQFEVLEKARALDPKAPSIWNNLANYYGHNGAATKAFDYYAKAIELNPKESLYYHNYATTVFLFRVDAMEHFKIDEQKVFDKALDLYQSALKLDPKNFPLAADVASTYYGIQPRRPDAALGAWTNALSLAHDEIEREGVYVHFARVNIAAGRLDTARAHLNTITNEMYADLKKRLARALTDKETEEKQPAPPPAEKPGEPKS